VYGEWLGPRSGTALSHAGFGRPLLTAAAARSFYNNPNGWARCLHHRCPRAACALERFLKNRSRDRQTTRTLSTVFPNSRSRTPPCPATGIRADVRAYTPARDGGFVRKAYSTAFPGQPAKAEPSRLCETSRRGPHNRRALQRASRAASGALGQSRTGLLRRAVRAVSCGGTFRCGAVSLTHLVRTLCMCVKIARDGAGLAGRFGSPCGRVKMFDQNLVM